MKNKNREIAYEKAKHLVSKMTLEEKVSQLTFEAKPIDRLSVKAYNWWSEALHGVARAGTATVFPQAIALAATFCDEFIYKVANCISDEGRAKYNAAQEEQDYDIYKGLTFWSPNVNIFRDPRWGRGHETYGEDPFLTGRLGVAFIKGIQGDKEYLKGAACAKHFAVHSGPEDLRHSFDAVVSLKDLWETYLPAFYDCIKEGDVESVMGAYNRTNGEPCCGSYTLLHDILREKWEFEGHVVSDCWALKDFHMHHMVTTNALESVALAIGAGCDLNCGNMYINLLLAEKEGLVTEEQITTSCERLFTTRYYLGIMQETEFDNIPYSIVDSKENNKLSLEAAEKSIVLLKNDGILPLNKEKIKSIAVIGPNANSISALKGNYHGTASRYTTFLSGIQEELADTDIRIYYATGSHLTKDRTEDLAAKNDRIKEAITIAKLSDVVILCLGLDETIEGEEGDQGNVYFSGDKKDLKLPEPQQLLLKELVALNKPIVLVLSTGSAVDINLADEKCNAVLQAWYSGAHGGTATANILFGKVSPSAKLPITFYANEEQLPDFLDYSMENRTYKYFTGDVLYPFGYGLTYANVQITDFKILNNPSKDDDINVLITIENTSAIKTEEVIQIYIKDTVSKFAAKNHTLCQMKRIEINGFEKKEINLTIKNNCMTVVNDKGERFIDSNNFTLYAGFSQPDSRSLFLTGGKIKSCEFVI